MNVRKYLVLGSLALAGCQSPVDDMLNNNFVQIKAEPAPSQIIGFWTGNMGPYLASLSSISRVTGTLLFLRNSGRYSKG